MPISLIDIGVLATPFDLSGAIDTDGNEIFDLAAGILSQYIASPYKSVPLYFMQAPAGQSFPYAVYTWDGSVIDEICGSRDDRIETADLTFSVFSRADDGGIEALKIAQHLMQLFDWSRPTNKVLAFQRTSVINNGKIDDIWDVEIDYEVMYEG